MIGSIKSSPPMSALPTRDFSMSTMLSSMHSDAASRRCLMEPMFGRSPCFKFWTDGRKSHDFHVRGDTYFADSKKVPAGDALCTLLWFDIFSIPESCGPVVNNIGSKGTCAERINVLTSGADAPFIFLTAIQVPGTPILYLVMYWGLDTKFLGDGNSVEPKNRGFSNVFKKYIQIPPSMSSDQSRSCREKSDGEGERCAKTCASSPAQHCTDTEDRSKRFYKLSDTTSIAKLQSSNDASVRNSFSGSSDHNSATLNAASDVVQPGNYVISYINRCAVDAGEKDSNRFHLQNSKFKLIPKIVQGPWLIKKLVGAVPCLLGTKVDTRYYRGTGYVETNSEVGSSSIAHRVISCCRSASKSINVQLGIVLQGEHSHELPERLLGCIQFEFLNVDDARHHTPLFR